VHAGERYAGMRLTELFAGEETWVALCYLRKSLVERIGVPSLSVTARVTLQL
jgi:hypothetical protein